MNEEQTTRWNQFPGGGAVDEAELQARVDSALSSVYLWMTGALALTGSIAFWVANDLALVRSMLGTPFIVLCVVELALVFGLGAAIKHLSFGVAMAGFLLYSALNGVTLSTIFLVYTSSSISRTFFITGATFGTMALIGHTTRANLSSIGSYLLMALIGLVIASVVNLFLGSERLDWIVSIVGVLVFVGLTAYDAQKVRRNAEAAVFSGSGDFRKVALMGSLELYLDFINLFLYLLRFAGRRR